MQAQTTQWNCRTSTLPNGIRVITNERPDFGMSVGAFLDAGVRDETQDSRGACHVLNRLAFQGYGSCSAEQLRARMDKIGGRTSAQALRENLIFSFETLPSDFEEMMDILCGTLLHPRVTTEDIHQLAYLLPFEQDALKRDHLNWMIEEAHNVAYQGGTLGRTLLPEVQDLENITPAKVHQFLQDHVVGEKLVIAGTGISHDVLVKAVEKHLHQVPSRSQQRADAPERSKSVFLGGGHMTNPSILHNPEHLPPLTHMALIFKGFSWLQKESYAQHVLHVLLGGGNAFSSGGPGKGMYSRYYLRVLNRYHFINSATSVTQSYSDSGIFGIYMNSPHDKAMATMQVCVSELVRLVIEPYSEEELNRAKAQLKSMMVMQLESRSIMTEHMGRSLLALGECKSALETCALIDQVTADDCQQCAQKMLFENGVLGFAAQGDAHNLASHSQLQEFFSPHALQGILKESGRS